nr:proline-rich protein 7 isoform X2 [Caretta caretta]
MLWAVSSKPCAREHCAAGPRCAWGKPMAGKTWMLPNLLLGIALLLLPFSAPLLPSTGDGGIPQHKVGLPGQELAGAGPMTHSSSWPVSQAPESDLSKPPCYEEALLMAEPPPPYSEVLMDTRGLYRKINAPFLSHERPEKQEQPPSYKPLFLDRGYSSALHLPSSASQGPACPALYLEAEHAQRMFPSWMDSELSGRDTYEPGAWHLPVSMPLFGRTTAV